jgi:hypothetical protein
MGLVDRSSRHKKVPLLLTSKETAPPSLISCWAEVNARRRETEVR